MTGRAWWEGRIVPRGEAVWPVDDPAITVGWTVFETARVVGAAVPRLDRHLERLEASAAEAAVPWPGAAVLAREVEALVADWRSVSTAGRLRITLSGSGRRVHVVGPVEPGRRGAPVRCVTGPHRDEPFLGGRVKHGSRAPWVVAVRRSGVDDVLLVDGEGRFTEATTAGVLAVIDGVVHTAPDDGRILPSTTVEHLLETAEAEGIAVVRTGARPDGRLDGLYLASATRHLAPVVRLDGRPLVGWEPVGEHLAAADVARG